MKTINTARIIEALRNVKAEESVRVFCSALADRVDPEACAEGIVFAVGSLCYDLTRGKSIFSDKPLPASMLGYPPITYELIRREVVRIVAIRSAPEDFDDVAAVFGLSDDPIIRSLNKAKFVPLTDMAHALLAVMGPSRET